MERFCKSSRIVVDCKPNEMGGVAEKTLVKTGGRGVWGYPLFQGMTGQEFLQSFCSFGFQMHSILFQGRTSIGHVNFVHSCAQRGVDALDWQRTIQILYDNCHFNF